MDPDKLLNPLFTLTIGEFIELNKQIIRETLSELQLNENNAPLTVNKEILSIAEVSEMLNISKSTVYGMNNRRVIPFIKQGKKVYYKRSEILEWLNRGRIKTQKEIEDEADKYIMRHPRKRF